ncbi:MAG: EthD domain-containing protein [Chloroflexota bacterium]|nr:EthD domain-containing protein [Chloroflexota bacterium]
MLKWIVPVTRKEGVERESFREFWRCIHAPHVANLAKPVRYCVTLFDSAGSLGGGPSADEMRYDGVAELTFRDFDHFSAAFHESKGALRTIDGFAELTEPQSDGLFTTERCYVDEPTADNAIKWIAFVKRGEGVSREDLFSAWRFGHSPRVAEAIARSEGQCSQYTVSHADQGIEGGPWDGIASLWFRDAAAAGRPLPATETGDPFPPLIDAGATIILQGREYVIVS